MPSSRSPLPPGDLPPARPARSARPARPARRLARVVLVLALVAVGAGYALAFLPVEGPYGAAAAGAAPWLLLVGTVVALLAVAVPGMARRPAGSGGPTGGSRGARWGVPVAMGAVFVLVIGGIGGALLVPDPGPESPLVGGLPLGAALVVYGAGLLPLLVVPLAYAWSFDETGFTPGEMEAVVAAARRASDEG